MTGVRVVAVPRAMASAGRYPRLVILGYVARRAVRSGALWGLVFAVFVYVQILAYTTTYTTQQSRDALLEAFGANIGSNALIGPVRAINTVAGFASWRMVGILSLLGAVWGLLTATRLMRGEEATGRYELLLAGQTTRRRAAVQTMAGLGVGLVVLFAMTAAGAVLTGRDSAVGFTVGQSLYFALTLVAGAAVFLAIGALASQLVDTRRRAAAMAGVIFGIAYAIRMVADANPGLHWMVWLSPLGWIEQSRPLTDPNPLALMPVLTLILVTTAVTVHLAGVRDLAAGTLRVRDTSPPRLALLKGPVGLAARLMRPVALGWLFGVAAFAGLIGVVAESSTKDSTESTTVGETMSRLGGDGSPVQEFLGLTFLLIALMIALIAAGQVTAIRAEESAGRLDHLLVRPLSRSSWLAGRLILSALLLAVAGLLAGVAAWAGTVSQHSDVDLGSLIGAGLNVVPPALFLLGLGVLGLGAWPRHTAAVVYGYLAWSFLIELTGALVRVNRRLMDTSIFFHLAPAPATSPDWASAAVIVGLGLAGALVGGAMLHRRDVVSA